MTRIAIVNLWTTRYFCPMRLRFPELLEARGLTPYALAKHSDGRLSRSFCYRIVQDKGAFRCLSPEQLDALCELLECEPSELFASGRARRRA